MKNKKSILLNIFQTAIYSVSDKNYISKKYPKRPKGKILVIGAGKASSSMATALEQAWGNDLEGIIITQYGYKTKTKSINVIEANHPIPDKNGIDATIKIINLLGNLKKEDTVVCLFSGGGSSLLTAPSIGRIGDDELLASESLADDAWVLPSPSDIPD